MVRLLLCVLLVLAHPALAQESVLDAVRREGVLVVGTTGDYPPFSRRQADGTLEGFDIEVVRRMARELGVEVRFVPTRWNRLTQDLAEGKFHLAVGGITRTLQRAADGGFTRSYMVIGKSPLVRLEDAHRFRTLEAIDQPGVRVAVNPGGTNEAFARERLRQATLVVIEDNLSIPEAIAAGEVDVMFTDNVEARLTARQDPRLAAVRPDAPLTEETLGYLAPRQDQAFLNWLNLFLEQMEVDGTFEELKTEWF